MRFSPTARKAFNASKKSCHSSSSSTCTLLLGCCWAASRTMPAAVLDVVDAHNTEASTTAAAALQRSGNHHTTAVSSSSLLSRRPCCCFLVPKSTRRTVAITPTTTTTTTTVATNSQPMPILGLQQQQQHLQQRISFVDQSSSSSRLALFPSAHLIASATTATTCVATATTTSTTLPSFAAAATAATATAASIPTLLQTLLVSTLSFAQGLAQWQWFLMASVLIVLLPTAASLIQAAVAVLDHRNFYGTPPVPVIPSHGVVYCSSSSNLPSFSSSSTSSSTSPTKPGKSSNNNKDTKMKTNAADTASSSLSSPSQSPPSLQELLNRHEAPLRLLVLGDSLGVGVGQSYSAVPELPLQIAKTLSDKLHKVVYWTCYGQSGASTTWIINELQQHQEQEQQEQQEQQQEQAARNGHSKKAYRDDFENYLKSLILQQPHRASAVAVPKKQTDQESAMLVGSTSRKTAMALREDPLPLADANLLPFNMTMDSCAEIASCHELLPFENDNAFFASGEEDDEDELSDDEDDDDDEEEEQQHDDWISVAHDHDSDHSLWNPHHQQHHHHQHLGTGTTSSRHGTTQMETAKGKVAVLEYPPLTLQQQHAHAVPGDTEDLSVDEASTADSATAAEAPVQFAKHVLQDPSRFNVFGLYDVIVVLTGPNDMKSMLLPKFMRTSEDIAQLEKVAQSMASLSSSSSTSSSSSSSSSSAKASDNVFAQELQRLLDTLDNKVSDSLHAFRDSIEAGLESVRESMDKTRTTVQDSMSTARSQVKESLDNARETVRVSVRQTMENATETILSGGRFEDFVERRRRRRHRRSSRTGVTDDTDVENSATDEETNAATSADNNDSFEPGYFFAQEAIVPTRNGEPQKQPKEHMSKEANMFSATLSNSQIAQDIVEHAKSRRTPLVVLPGLPCRALPVLSSVPLRWVGIPVVEKLDQHKKNLEKAHRDNVLYVPPPTLRDIAQYEHEKGAMWEQRSHERTVLSLCDIPEHEQNRIEHDMKEYYDQKGYSAAAAHHGWARKLFTLQHIPGKKVFAIDHIHPNDDGYDLWARHIANAIAKDWETKNASQQP